MFVGLIRLRLNLAGGVKMGLLKEVTIEAIKKLPDECSFEDIMYEINFVAQVFDGLKDAKNGNLLTTEELLSRVEQWAR